MAADEDPAPAPSLEALQREHALARMRLGEAIGLLSGAQADSVKLRAEVDAARAELGAVRADLDGVRGELQAARAELGAAQGELAATRPENQRLAAALAASESGRAHLASVLAQDGHRFVTRTGDYLDRHPRLRALLLPVARLALRLTGRR